ncbi:hypothetical protein ACGFYQ_34980 [Streptomyces sp. NPDC048258]
MLTYESLRAVDVGTSVEISAALAGREADLPDPDASPAGPDPLQMFASF